VSLKWTFRSFKRPSYTRSLCDAQSAVKWNDSETRIVAAGTLSGTLVCYVSFHVRGTGMCLKVASNTFLSPSDRLDLKRTAFSYNSADFSLFSTMLKA